MTKIKMIAKDNLEKKLKKEGFELIGEARSNMKFTGEKLEISIYKGRLPYYSDHDFRFVIREKDDVYDVYARKIIR